MAISLTQIKKYRRWFGWGFVLSLVVLVPLLIWSFMLAAPQVLSPFYKGSPASPAVGGIDLPALLALTSFLTSCTTLVGFAFTTAVAWRKERRENASAEVELEKKKLELEKLRLELEKTKRSGNDATTRS